MSSSQTMRTGWSELPPELLFTIAKSLTTNTDYIRLRAVCSSWRSAITSTPRHLPLQFPWLAFPSHSQQQEEQQHDYNFFSLPDGKLHSLPLPKSNQFIGSSDGWLVIRAHSTSAAISLLNPITRSRLHLPYLKTFPMSPFFIKKIVLSPPPIAALAILGWSTHLALSRPGDQSWTLLKGNSSYHDALFFNGRFHVVDGFRRVFACDDNGGLTEVVRVEILRVPPFLRRGEKCYLVESAGDLFLVVRHFNSIKMEDQRNFVVTKGFEVFRLELNSNGQPSSVALKSLGNCVLFLGLNRSLSLSADDHPGCRGNCIYFVDDMLNSMGDVAHRNHDAGVYDMGDGRMEPLPCYTSDSGSVHPYPPAVWVTPCLC